MQHHGQLQAPSPSRGTVASGQEGEWGPAMGQGTVGTQGIRGSKGLGSAGRAELVIEVQVRTKRVFGVCRLGDASKPNQNKINHSVHFRSLLAK